MPVNPVRKLRRQTKFPQKLRGLHNHGEKKRKCFFSRGITRQFSNGVKQQKLIAIVGPTASGKSECAVIIAQKISAFGGGEIISADSRQVYRGMDIGTGKVEGEWQSHKFQNPNAKLQINPKSKILKNKTFVYKKIPHYCVDEVSPKKQYSVAEFKKCADRAIHNIVSRGKIPILCGGTGFWIDAVVYDMSLPNVPPNPALRKKLAKKTAKELLAILKKIDMRRAKIIEQKNPRRLIRAIEIARSLGKVPPLKKNANYNILWLGIKKPCEELRRLIAMRLKKRLKQGMVREIKKLLAEGVPHRRLQELGLEYKFVSLYLQGKLSKEQMTQKLQTAIEQYARRQEVWFKRNKKIRWIQNAANAARYIKRFLS